jgi:hypothetical protein
MAILTLFTALTLLASTTSAAPQFNGGGKVRDPVGAAPRRQELRTDHPIPGVKRVKIRSGPYNAPNMNKVSLPTMEHGMLWNYPDRSIDKPCDECTILRQWAGLEYPNGTDANIDTGMWLHHMVHFTQGPSRWDAVCYNSMSLPHTAVFMRPASAERYFSSGNERSVFDFNKGGTDMSKGTGYHLTKEDSYAFLVDLMNANMDDRVVYMTMTYDIIPGPLPKGWNTTKTVWLDAFSCGTSEVWPPKEKGQFQISSGNWKPNFEGRVIDSIGHLHDGGVEIQTKVGSLGLACNSTAQYAERPEYVFRGKQMGTDRVARDHISSMTHCDLKIPYMRKDQQWQVIGKYDFDKREGNLENGKQSEIMAITMVLIETPPGGAPKPK